MKLFKKALSLLLALLMVLSMVYLAPAEHAHAASAGDYIAKTYPSYLSIQTTKVTHLYNYPTANSTIQHTLAAGTMLTVTALHKNTDGEYWYKVTYYKKTYYVDATAAQRKFHLTGDVTGTDLVTPAALGYGHSFTLKGSITSGLNQLTKVTASIYKGSNITAAPVASSSATPGGNSFSIENSDVDNNLAFGSLAAGSYTFVLEADATSYYVTADGSLNTSVKKVVLDSKPLIVTNANSANPVIAKGIDISHWQGTVDWAATSQAVDFVILRVGSSTKLDTQFTNNITGCTTYGVPFGVYHYSHATSADEAKAEAEFVLSSLKGYKLDLPVFFDFEDPSQSSLTTATIKSIVKAFCDTIHAGGRKAGIYSSGSWFDSFFSDPYYNTLPKWVAQINTTCEYTRGVTIWQYSWTGSVPGIAGNVDMDYYYGEFPGKSTDTSYLSKCTCYPSNSYIKAAKDCPVRQFPASSYSTITTIPNGTKVRATALYKNAAGNFWYEVEYNGCVGYVLASNTTYSSPIYTDVTINGQAMADNLTLGSSYKLSGKANSINNKMITVHAKIFSGEDTTAAAVISSSAAVNSKTYNLYSSDVCEGLSFGKLAKGYYTYELSADVKNYYYDGALQYKSKNVVLWTAPFTVDGASVTAPTGPCTHTAVIDKAVAATCTATGLTEGSHCSYCGYVIEAQTVTNVLDHNYVKTVIPATCQSPETIRYTCSWCSDSYTETSSAALGAHSWSDGECTLCQTICSHDWSDGVCSICRAICGHSWINGSCPICGSVCDHNWDNGRCQSCGFTCLHLWMDGVCGVCGNACAHSYVNGVCTDCGIQRPPVDYYLFGYINGANYGCEEDYENMGRYLFVDGKLITTFEMDSYVAIKTGGNESWYMLSEWLGTEATAATLYNTVTGVSEKLFVPGGVEVTFTLTVNDDGTLGLSYVPLADPTITPVSPSLALEEEIRYNIYFTVSDLGNVPLENMGLIAWSASTPDGTIDTAEFITAGAIQSGDHYIVHSDGIPAKELGDNRYFKIYAKLSNGTYVYSSMFRFSGKMYAEMMLSYSSDTELKRLCVALLNYGAAAQEYFDYKSSALMNDGLTQEQKALVNDYSSDMVTPMMKADSAKSSQFAAVAGGFSSMMPSVSLEGAFAINYYFTPAKAVDGEMTFYYWDQEAYNAADVLTTENALGARSMAKDASGQYWAVYDGIAAKELGDTVFVAAVYESDGVTYCTGVLACSVAAFSAMQMSYGSAAIQTLTQKVLVYGYYAKEYFG